MNITQLHTREQNLILNQAFQYLSPNQLKQCRLVNHLFFQNTIPYYFKELRLVYPAKTHEFSDKQLIEKVTNEFYHLIQSYLPYQHIVETLEMNIFCNESLILTILTNFSQLTSVKFVYVDFFEIDTSFIYREFGDLDEITMVGCSNLDVMNCYYNLIDLKFPLNQENIILLQNKDY